MTTPAASKKRGGDRYYAVPHPETRELLDLPSWSALKGQLLSKGLEKWKMSKVAQAVAMSPALQMEAANPETVYSAVDKALSADTEKADLGTFIHKYVEQSDAGTLDWEFVPEVARPYIEHYERERSVHGWHAVEAEATIYNLTFGYAGSTDGFHQFPGLAERLGLPNPEKDIFGADVKTGEKIWTETALQITAYVNGEGILQAPSKSDLGFNLREATLEDQIRSGVGFDRINPGRRKWSAEAIKEAKAELEEQWWAAYAKACTFRPMPERLRRDVGVVIHLRADGCKLVPVRLNAGAKGETSPILVIAGLCCLWKWNTRKDVIMPSIDERNTPDVADPSMEPDSDTPALGAGPDVPAPVASDSDGQHGAAGAPGQTDPCASPPAGEGRAGNQGKAALADAEADLIPLPEGWKPGDRATHWQQWHTEPDGTTYRAAELCRPWLQACIGVLTRPQKEQLAASWPAGLPTLKQSAEHTVPQLSLIRETIMAVAEGATLPHPADCLDCSSEAMDATIATLERTGLLEGARSVFSDDEDAKPETVACYIDWLDDIADRRPELLPELRDRLNRAGLRKKLRSDIWTIGELRRWGRTAADVERAALAHN